MASLMEVDHSRVLRIAERLVARRETIAVSESSAGGLIRNHFEFPRCSESARLTVSDGFGALRFESRHHCR